MLPFSGNNQNINIFGVPPEHFAIGYAHNDILPLGNIALQSSFKTIAGRSDGVFDDFLYFLKIEKKNC